MLKNYFLIGFRNIIKHKVFSAINILGLAIGIACSILIFQWIWDEVSWDMYHENSANIYMTYSEYPDSVNTWQTSYSCPPLGPALIEKYPEVKQYARVRNFSGLIKYDKVEFSDETIVGVDSSFFEIFTMPFAKGNPKSAFKDPFSIVLTESIAKKYFGENEAIGKSLMIDNEHHVIVKGVVKDMPKNSDFQFDMILPYEFFTATEQFNRGWISGRIITYLLLKNNTKVAEFEKKIQNIGLEHEAQCGYIVKLQALKKIHLFTLTGEKEAMIYVYIFSAVAFLIMLIACINFMNLSTARSLQRSKEIGLRKVIGAQRNQIIKQFYIESIIIVLISMQIAMVIVEALTSSFNNLTGKSLSIDYWDLNFVLALLIIAIFTSIVSGSYPALYISSFKPIKILRASFVRNSQKSHFRKVLVIVQFSISIFLIVSTCIIFSQLQFLRNKDLGFDKDNLIFIQLNRELLPMHNTIKNELLSCNEIISASVTGSRPSSIGFKTSSMNWEGKPQDATQYFVYNSVDFDYVKTFKLEIVEGRDFSAELPTDTFNFIVNETAVEFMGFDDPIGKKFSHWDMQGQIIGVVKDFNFMPLNQTIEPILFTITSLHYQFIFVRYRVGKSQEAINHITKTWEKFSPGFPADYQFFEDDFADTYKTQERMSELFSYFTVIAILISCLGLFGLAAFVVEQKTKEIALKKVLGASVQGIVFKLSKEFTKWVVAANIIAWPLAYIFAKEWLMEFAYSISINWLFFIFAAVLSYVIALITISMQAIKAANKNPIDCLRFE